MAAMQPSTASKGVKIEGRKGATPHLRRPKVVIIYGARGMFPSQRGMNHKRHQRFTDLCFQLMINLRKTFTVSTTFLSWAAVFFWGGMVSSHSFSCAASRSSPFTNEAGSSPPLHESIMAVSHTDLQGYYSLPFSPC